MGRMDDAKIEKQADSIIKIGTASFVVAPKAMTNYSRLATAMPILESIPYAEKQYIIQFNAGCIIASDRENGPGSLRLRVESNPANGERRKMQDMLFDSIVCGRVGDFSTLSESRCVEILLYEMVTKSWLVNIEQIVSLAKWVFGETDISFTDASLANIERAKKQFEPLVRLSLSKAYQRIEEGDDGLSFVPFHHQKDVRVLCRKHGIGMPEDLKAEIDLRKMTIEELLHFNGGLD